MPLFGRRRDRPGLLGGRDRSGALRGSGGLVESQHRRAWAVLGHGSRARVARDAIHAWRLRRELRRGIYADDRTRTAAARTRPPSPGNGQTRDRAGCGPRSVGSGGGPVAWPPQPGASRASWHGRQRRLGVGRGRTSIAAIELPYRRAVLRGDRGDRGIERKHSSRDLAAGSIQRCLRAALLAIVVVLLVAGERAGSLLKREACGITREPNVLVSTRRNGSTSSVTGGRNGVPPPTTTG